MEASEDGRMPPLERLSILLRTIRTLSPELRLDVLRLSDLPVVLDHLTGLAPAETLGRYLLSGGNLTQTAARLGVTTRTIRNRLRSIETESGLDLRSGIDMLIAALTLALADLPQTSASFVVSPRVAGVR